MPPPKKADTKKPAPTQIEEAKPVTKPQPPPEPKEEEDRIDFVNVKDLIKGMERQGNEPKVTDPKDTNGFHKKITDNGHDSTENNEIEIVDDNPETTNEKAEEPIEKTEKTIQKTEKTIEKTDSSDSSDSDFSRSNSLINGVPVQAPKPLPRSSISEGGSTEDFNEVPKPKPRTTTGQIAGYKVLFGS